MDAHSDLFAAIGLVDMHSKCEMMDDARRAYDSMCILSVKVIT